MSALGTALKNKIGSATKPLINAVAEPLSYVTTHRFGNEALSSGYNKTANKLRSTRVPGVKRNLALPKSNITI